MCDDSDGPKSGPKGVARVQYSLLTYAASKTEQYPELDTEQHRCLFWKNALFFSGKKTFEKKRAFFFFTQSLLALSHVYSQ